MRCKKKKQLLRRQRTRVEYGEQSMILHYYKSFIATVAKTFKEDGPIFPTVPRSLI